MKPARATPEAAGSSKLQRSLQLQAAMRNLPVAKRRVSASALQLFTLQFSVMLNAQVGIIKALDVLARGEDQGLNAIINRVRINIESGNRLSFALSQESAFPPAYVRTAQVAEESGQLSQVFTALYQTQERSYQLQSKLKSALSYPFCLMLASGSMLAFLLYVQVPSFLHIFVQTGTELPLLTRLLVVLGSPRLALSVLVLVASLGALLYRFTRTPQGLARFYEWLYAVPVLGKILFLTGLCRLVSDLAVQLDHGVLLVNALATAERSPDLPPLLKASIPRISARVREGIELATAFDAEGYLPRTLIISIEVSQGLGQLGKGFRQYLTLAEGDLENRLAVLTSLVEPLVMGVMGVLVGIIVLGSFLPIYQLLGTF